MAANARGEITRHGKTCSSVFDLLGHQENDLTAALGFTLAQSPRLLAAIVKRLLPDAEAARAAVRLETRDDLGRTDLEIQTPAHLVVVEAKRGWDLPDVPQLEQYAERIWAGGGLLVTLSDCSPAWAATRLPPVVKGIPVRHLPWGEVRSDLDRVRPRVRGQERVWLDELDDYLRRAIRMLDPADSWAYCVALSRARPGGGGTRTFLDFVVEEGVYFHPFGWGGGWPKTPPNFMAFRWDSKVQRVQRVVDHEVIPDLQTRWPDIPIIDDTGRPHVVYQLGPPLRFEAIPAGKPYRAIRFKVLLDQLLTCETLADAHTRSELLADAHASSSLSPHR